MSVREPGSIEVDIDLGSDHGRPITIGSAKHFQGDLGVKDLAVTPPLDGMGAAKLAADIIDHCAACEEGIECYWIVVVD